jgi:D-sedoheptulose 7-phosphate isomerase
MKNKNIDVIWRADLISNSMPDIKVNSEIELLNKDGWRSHTVAIGNSLRLVREKQLDVLLKGIWDIYINEKQFFICGNGGSACNSNHFAQDLTKGTIENGLSRPRIKAISLCNDIGFITATSNDDSYDNIFKHQLVTYANRGDGLLVLSGSGNSKNLIEAVEWGKGHGMKTYGILGYDGGILKDKLLNHIHINLNHMEKCEGIMSIILHYIMCELKELHKVSLGEYEGS